MLKGSLATGINDSEFSRGTPGIHVAATYRQSQSLCTEDNERLDTVVSYTSQKRHKYSKDYEFNKTELARETQSARSTETSSRQSSLETHTQLGAEFG